MSDVTRILSAIEAGDAKAAAELLPLVYDELRKLAAAHLAAERPGHTLQSTALVHEAYLRLVGTQHPQNWNGRGHFFAAAAEAMRRILVNRARDKGRKKRGGGWQRVDLERLSVADEASDEELVAIDDALQELARKNGPCAELVSLRFFAAAAEAMRRVLLNRARDKGRQKRGGSWQRVDLDRLLVADQASEEELVAIDDALQELARRNAPCAELVKLRFFTGLTLDEAADAMGVGRRTANRYWAFARAWLFDALRPE